MNLFKRVYLDEHGEEQPDLRDKSLDSVEMAFKIIGGIFTVCFPLAVGLLWNMTRDMHTISEKMVQVSTTQLQQVGTMDALQRSYAELVKSNTELIARMAVLETKQAAHEAEYRSLQNMRR
jgi:hypothetical protein